MKTILVLSDDQLGETADCVVVSRCWLVPSEDIVYTCCRPSRLEEKTISSAPAAAEGVGIGVIENTAVTVLSESNVIVQEPLPEQSPVQLRNK